MNDDEMTDAEKHERYALIMEKGMSRSFAPSQQARLDQLNAKIVEWCPRITPAQMIKLREAHKSLKESCALIERALDELET